MCMHLIQSSASHAPERPRIHMVHIQWISPQYAAERNVSLNLTCSFDQLRYSHRNIALALLVSGCKRTSV